MTTFTFSFTLQSHFNKLVRAILETYTCPNPTLGAQERLSAVGRQRKEPDLNPLKVSKILFSPISFQYPRLFQVAMI